MGKINLADQLAGARARVDQQRDGTESEVVPKFQRLTRKEARVREDQYAALSSLARRLMRARRTRVERITENTLIRVAIDLLLAHQAELCGSSEVELRKSVTSRPRESDTPAVTDSATPVRTDPGGCGVTDSRTASLPEVGTPAVGRQPGGISL